MRTVQSSSVLLSRADYFYVVLSCIAGVWQAWCVNWGRNALWAIPMGLPFALASCIRASFWPTIIEHPDWKRMVVLWAGMPLSLISGALAMAAETGIMYSLGWSEANLPFYSVRVLIGESAACFAWAKCLQVWSHRQRIGTPHGEFFSFFAPLLLCVVVVHGLSILVPRAAREGIYCYLMSMVITTMSALIVTLKENATNHLEVNSGRGRRVHSLPTA